MLHPEIPNALTVDLEDYFQVSAFDDRVRRDDWDKLECRVERSTETLLRTFDQASVRATFFVLGWIADRYPGLIRRIAEEGHELASHGYWHRLVYQQTPEEFAQDLKDSRESIANATGVEVSAYRAPSFSITQKSEWAVQILTELGFQVDSSIFPISGHDRYGYPGAKKEIHELETESGKLKEYPPSAWSVGKVQVPIGGGYFRLFPLKLTLQAIRAVRQAGRPAMFYTHPWEYDPEQPRFQGVGGKTRFRHYVGLRTTEKKLRKMLQSCPFGTMLESMSAMESS